MYNEKVLGDSKMKGGRVTIPKKVREKLSIKDGDFLTYLLTKNGFVKTKKFIMIMSILDGRHAHK